MSDEAASLIVMRRQLKCSIGEVEVSACFERPYEAIDYIKSNPVGIVFIDIKMSAMNCFDLANILLSECASCLIIFTTAHNKHTFDVCQINELDCLSRPLDDDRLSEPSFRPEQADKPADLPYNWLDVECFGKFNVFVSGKRLEFRTKKSEEILALLLDRQGQSIFRSQLIDRLWKEFDGDKAIVNLNTNVHYLRKTLAQNGLANIILHENGSYRITRDRIRCDFWELMSCLAEPVTEHSAELFERLVDRYTGDYLEANEYSWAETSRISAKQKCISIILHLADYYRMHNQCDDLMELMKKGILIAPENNKITFCLVETLIKMGYYCIAYDYYKVHCTALQKNYNRQPDKALTALLFPTLGI